MKLIIGGYAQGKLNFALQKENMEEWVILDGKIQDEQSPKKVIVNHFHIWIKECLQRGGSPEEEVSAFLRQNEDCIIISDEIGNGIVPIDAFEREYRERTGRILVELAGKADEVVRVICGIGQKIK